MKRTNAYYRKHGTCMGFEGLDEAAAQKLDAQIQRAHSWDRQPYPSCHLSNNNANIKRIAERLKALDAIPAQADAAPPIEGDGFRVLQNTEACRAQILFDDKPDEPPARCSSRTASAGHRVRARDKGCSTRTAFVQRSTHCSCATGRTQCCSV